VNDKKVRLISTNWATLIYVCVWLWLAGWMVGWMAKKFIDSLSEIDKRTAQTHQEKK
jgi:hypothetical protein